MSHRDLSPYPSPEAAERETIELGARAGAELVEYGRSEQGRPLLALRLPSASGPGATMRVLCAAGIHGVEYVSTRVATELLLRASHDDHALSKLRAQAEVWVIPRLNPDGYARTWEARGEGSLAHLRTNANGVDLNRNFPLPHRAKPCRYLPWAGSDRPGSSNYRGVHPLSEPETAALDELFARCKFHASINLHSFMGTLIPAHVRDSEAYSCYRHLTRVFRFAQPRNRYRRLASRWFDVFTGEQEDHQHHHHGTWAVCVETFTLSASIRQTLYAPSLFWRFNPRDPASWAANDVPGVVDLLTSAAQLARPPKTP
ncbi:MAG: M14 family metallopeptidase [Nannocystaceae bacterium]